MSKNEDIDDLFRKRFEEEERPVSNRVWENIKNELPTEDERPHGYFWPALLVVALIIVSVIGTFIINKNRNSTFVQENAENNKETHIAENGNTNESKNTGEVRNNGVTDTSGNKQKNVQQNNLNNTEKAFLEKRKTNNTEGNTTDQNINTSESAKTKKEKNKTNSKTTVSNKGEKEKSSDKNTGGEKTSKNKNRKSKSFKNPVTNSDEDHAGTSNAKNTNGDDTSRNKKHKSDSFKNPVAINSNENKDAIKNDKNIATTQSDDKAENYTAKKNTDKTSVTDKNYAANKNNTSEDESKNAENKKDDVVNPFINKEALADKNDAGNKNINPEKNNKEEVNNKSLNDTTTAKDPDNIKDKEVVNGNDKTGTESDPAITKNPVLAKENKKEENADTIKSEEEKKIIDSTAVAEEKKKDKEAKSSRFSFDVFLAPSANYRSLSSAGPDSADRDQYEKFKMSLGGGARVNYSISDKFSLGSGLVYENYGEKYKYKKDNIASYTTVYTAGYYVQDTLNNDSTFVPTDSVLNPNVVTTNYKNSNQYKYLSIPLFVTYNFGKGKLNFSITAGVAANILVKGNSARVVESGTIIKESSGANGPYRPLNFSLIISPGIAYDVKERWKLLIQPGLTYFINSIYKNGSLFVQRPYALDVKVGIRYLLKQK